MLYPFHLYLNILQFLCQNAYGYYSWCHTQLPTSTYVFIKENAFIAKINVYCLNIKNFILNLL